MFCQGYNVMFLSISTFRTLSCASQVQILCQSIHYTVKSLRIITEPIRDSMVALFCHTLHLANKNHQNISCVFKTRESV
jgi:hypothetical protein